MHEISTSSKRKDIEKRPEEREYQQSKFRRNAPKPYVKRKPLHRRNATEGFATQAPLTSPWKSPVDMSSFGKRPASKGILNIASKRSSLGLTPPEVKPIKSNEIDYEGLFGNNDRDGPNLLTGATARFDITKLAI